jgi:hypothetical protein
MHGARMLRAFEAIAVLSCRFMLYPLIAGIACTLHFLHTPGDGIVQGKIQCPTSW